MGHDIRHGHLGGEHAACPGRQQGVAIVLWNGAADEQLDVAGLMVAKAVHGFGHQFEMAARKVLVEYLEEQEEGIGSHVSVDHLAPCGVGKTIRIRAELKEVIRDRHLRVVCNMAAYDGDRLLARGKQVQVVMNKQQLAHYLERS